MADLVMKKGDLTPVVNATLKTSAGPMNLGGATVKFIMRLGLTGAVKVDAAATLINSPLGQVRYTWTGTDTDTVGDYICEWEVTVAGVKTTFPNGSYKRLRILPDLA